MCAHVMACLDYIPGSMCICAMVRGPISQRYVRLCCAHYGADMIPQQRGRATINTAWERGLSHQETSQRHWVKTAMASSKGIF